MLSCAPCSRSTPHITLGCTGRKDGSRPLSSRSTDGVAPGLWDVAGQDGWGFQGRGKRRTAASLALGRLMGAFQSLSNWLPGGAVGEWGDDMGEADRSEPTDSRGWTGDVSGDV